MVTSCTAFAAGIPKIAVSDFLAKAMIAPRFCANDSFFHCLVNSFPVFCIHLALSFLIISFSPFFSFGFLALLSHLHTHLFGIEIGLESL